MAAPTGSGMKRGRRGAGRGRLGFVMEDLVHQGLLLVGHSDRWGFWVEGLLEGRRGFVAETRKMTSRGG